MGTRITLELSDEQLAKLDKLSEPYMVFEKPISQYEWVTKDFEGRQLWWKVTNDHNWRRKPIVEMNRYITEKYREAVGYSKIGRPPLSKARSQVIAKLLDEVSGL